MSKHVVLVLGAGALAVYLIDYLSKNNNYHVRIVIRDAAKVDKFKDKGIYNLFKVSKKL